MNPIRSPGVELQVSFYWRLESLRTTLLLQALKKQVRATPVATLDKQLQELVPAEALAKVAGWGMRGELIFPVPELLRGKPCLLGYYRLLLGISQKEFYGSNYGLGPFKPMEERDQLSKKMPSGWKTSVRNYARALLTCATTLRTYPRARCTN